MSSMQWRVKGDPRTPCAFCTLTKYSCAYPSHNYGLAAPLLAVASPKLPRFAWQLRQPVFRYMQCSGK